MCRLIDDREYIDVVKRSQTVATTTKSRGTPPAANECCPSILAAALTEADAEPLARAFAALGDPVRLRLLSLIAAAGECCSCELEEPLDRSQPTISHHTKALADAGLIIGQKRGRWMWWTVAPERLEQLRSLLTP
jgi:ArsR family transcriptional regulator, arsenate/arsenite/antimonite-responsive transcriptional repressor